METLVLHHYWGSPYAEKVRLLLGYKGASWRSREISVTPPRPSLAPALGAFRRTPVLQLGADYVCDTRLIAEAIESLAPEPAVGAENAALCALLAQWVEPRVFTQLGITRFQTQADVDGVFAGRVSVERFSADRLPFMRPAYEAERYFQLAPSARDHVRRYLEVLESHFAAGGPFLGGARPAFADFSAAHTVWWLRVAPAIETLLAPFPAVASWADRVLGFGHGTHTAISDEESLALARRAWWTPPWPARPDERLDKLVEIVPDDYGRDPIAGRVVAMSDRHLAIERDAPGMGPVRIHFPRVGYEVTTL